MLCIASAVLPKVANTSAPAEKGTAKHAFLTNARNMGREKALELVPEEYRDLCEVIDLDKLPQGAEYQAEVALAYDVETEKTRFIGFDIGRNYGPLAETEIAMTIDILGLTPEGVVVIDAKTGYGKVTRASRNWQLKVAALAACRWKGLEQATVALAYVRDDGDPFYDPATFDAMDLAVFAEELRQLSRRITSTQDLPYTVKYTVGDHCRFCPSLPYCYAQTAMVHRLAGDPEDVGKDISDLLTPETASKAYERLKAVKEVLKRVETALYIFASQNPIQLSDGSVFGPVTKTVEDIDPLVAREVIETMMGPEAVEAAFTFETSKAGVERAARVARERLVQKGEKVTIKSLKEAALKAIEEAGGISTRTKTDLKEHKP